MTQKDLYKQALEHKKTERTPIFGYDSRGVGFGKGMGPWFEKGPVGGGYDGFHVRWVNPASGSGTPIPAPGEFILDEETIVDWKKLVTFPNVMDYDWEGVAKAELANIDRSQFFVDYGSGNGPFERLAALMGFESALIAMYDEPEACSDLINAIVDYKIQIVEQVAKYYKPDCWTNYDDVATERGLFMAPEVYRQLIKPATMRYYDALRAYDIMPIQHTCGYARDIIEDFIDLGAVAWTPVQPTNDIVDLQEKYGDKITIIGGFNGNGPAAWADASQEVIEEEVRRCFDTYGPGGSYIFLGFRLVNTMDPQDYARETGRVVAPAIEYAHKLAGK